MTPKQHCEKLIAERKEGYFKKISEEEDVCYLLGGNYFSTFIGAEYSYHYVVCEEITFTVTSNSKTVTAKELTTLTGGERIIIRANQDVNWVTKDTTKLGKVAMNATTFSFTMPKTGSFVIKATGKCDPSASKSITVINKQQTIPNNNAATKLNHALTFSGGLITGMDDAQTRAYAANVVQTESSFNQYADNKKGYYGLYQFGAAAFVEAGLIDRKKYDAAVKIHGKNISNGANAKIHSDFVKDSTNWVAGFNLDKFLKDKNLQNKSFVTYTNNNIKYASTDARKIMATDAAKTAAYLKMAHLKGPSHASKGIINPKYDVVDGNRTSMQKYGAGVAKELMNYTAVVREALAKKNTGK